VANGRAAVGHLISADVLSLFNKAVRDMSSRRLLIGLIGLLCGGLLLAGVSTGLARSHGGFGTPSRPAGEVREALAADPVAGEDRVSRDERPADAGGKPAETASRRTLLVVVLDPRGKPVEGADIHANIITDEKGFERYREYKTDMAGVALVELPRTMIVLQLWARKRAFAPLYANWEQNELASGQKLPAEYVFRMESGVTAGGRVVDEEGKPIAGARIRVTQAYTPKPAHNNGRTSYDTWLAAGIAMATTDAEGGWGIDNVPNHLETKLELTAYHPDYISDDIWGQSQRAAGITTALLRAGTATLTLKRGLVVRGRVTDSAGKPVRNVLVVQGDNPRYTSTPSEFPADSEGRYRLPALPAQPVTLTVIAPGWAPQLRRVTLKPGLPPQDFRLEKGKPIRLRVSDGAGKPISGAWVGVAQWRGARSLSNNGHPEVRGTRISDEVRPDGTWEWAWAPDDAVKLAVSAPGMAPCEVEVVAGSPERTVTLQPEHRVSGRVFDAGTGKPVPNFTLVPVYVFRKDSVSAVRGNAVAGRDGRLSYLAERTDIGLRLRVEAAGYRSLDGPEFRIGDDWSRTQHFRLQRSPPVAGTVLDADGCPAAKASVLLATPTQAAGLTPARGDHESRTDANGRFAFPDPGEPWAVVVRTDAGFAHAEFPAGQYDAGTLRLRPWASVRGRFRDGGRPVAGATVMLYPIQVPDPEGPRIERHLQTETGPDGRFEFPRVPPGPVNVLVYLTPWRDEGFRSGPRAPLDLRPGEKAELDMGGAGAVVTGRVKLTGKVPADLDCNYSLNYLVRREPGIQPPPAVAAAGFDARRGWSDAWRQTGEGQAYLQTLQSWFVKLAPDGTFRVSGVPPGEYDLAVAVYAKPTGCLIDPLARKVVRVKVTEADVKHGELALPEVAVTVVPVPAVGDTPTLTFQRPDGSTGSLTDLRGRHTVVHFWASWCGPCKHQLPTLRRLQARFAGLGLAALSLSLDERPEFWRAALKQHELPWSQGRLTSANEAGVSSVPVYWLLDPAGKIIALGDDPEELVRVLSDRLK
jgi:protocatechuate 3,4-dioxygenase beta subunit/thiol-disulfide isomerase/thioredoxin